MSGAHWQEGFAFVAGIVLAALVIMAIISWREWLDRARTAISLWRVRRDMRNRPPGPPPPTHPNCRCVIVPIERRD